MYSITNSAAIHKLDKIVYAADTTLTITLSHYFQVFNE